jgi:CRP/FNR family transcriptional regulator, anaerobic regulatory protein
LVNLERIISPEDQNTVCTSCAVKDHSAMKDCPAECLEIISAKKGVIAFLKGQRIVIEGTVTPYVYFVKSGKIKIYATDQAGHEMIIRFTKPGDLLGFENVDMRKELKLTAMAMENSLLCYLPHDTFTKLAKHFPQLSMGLLKYYKQEFEESVINSTKLAYLSVPGKVAYALWMMYKMYGVDKNDNTLNLLLSRQEIGNLAFTTKEQVSKTFSFFKKNGIIKTIGNFRIAINNLDALKNIAQV